MSCMSHASAGASRLKTVMQTAVAVELCADSLLVKYHG